MEKHRKKTAAEYAGENTSFFFLLY